MEKILIIYQLIVKQKLNGQKANKGLNIGISLGLIVLVLILLGKDIIGFVLGASINGKDIVGVFGFVYGAANLFYSINLDYNLKETKEVNIRIEEPIKEKKRGNSELKIIEMIHYAEKEKTENGDREKTSLVLRDEKKEEIKIEKEKGIEAEEKEEVLKGEDTPDEVLRQQLEELEQTLHLGEEIDENGLSSGEQEIEQREELSEADRKEQELIEFLKNTL